jgi:HAD superfamily hydrolase (TIGR01549 family)
MHDKVATTPVVSPGLAPREPFAALIFDCDGTLVDTVNAHGSAWRAAFAEYGIDMSSDWYAERVPLSANDLIIEMERHVGQRLDKAQVHARQLAFYLGNLDLVREREPVVAVARAFHGRVPLAVASSGTRRPVLSALRAVRIAGLFHPIVTAEDVRNGKPAPDVFLAAAEALGVRPADCVVYEDTDGGIRAAVAAGMRVIDVRQSNA